MIILGAGALARELLTVLSRNGEAGGIAFFDDVNEDAPDVLYERFPVLKSWNTLEEHFDSVSPDFALGVGNPAARKLLAEKARNIGGYLGSVISHQAFIGEFGNHFGEGVCVLPLANMTCGFVLGEGVLVNKSAIVSHDVKVGKYCAIAPGAILLGGSSIGDLTEIGAQATILPGIKVGSECVIGAGSVVTRDVPDGVTCVGVPARPIVPRASSAWS